MPTFEVTRDETIVEDAVYDVDPVVTTANPFGDYVVVKIDDSGGTKFDKYERGTRVDVDIDPSDFSDLRIFPGETVTTTLGTTDTYAGTIQNGGTYSNAGTVKNQDTSEIAKFTGYVVERRETEQGGADALEVEAYSFDQFLRRNAVTSDQTGNTIAEALKNIIETDTPVSYVSGNIDVGDNQELTRGYQGEKVENALRDLAFKSNNEEFGVNDDLEFFFRPRESTHIERGIDNTQWFNYDIPELGKQAINEVEVWFNGGDESVIVDDGTDKLDLQDNLNLPEPGTQKAELNRPNYTDISDAEDEGRKYLEFRNATLSGTVTTFGLYNAQPGDTIDIEIKSRGIDDEFVIAGIEYRWGSDETILTIIEKRGDVDGILSELNDSVKREEMQGANRDAPSNRITSTNATGLVDVTVDADGNTPDDDRFVNDGRRGVRDGWADKGNVAISNLVVGSDGSNLSRSNTSLENQTNSVAVGESLPTAKSAEYSASITQTNVSEVGLTDASGALITRAVFNSPVDLDGTVTVTLAVSNDDSVSRGVLTNDGQTAVRDILADNTPNIPDAYAYGSDGTAVSETDTALGNEIVETSLLELLTQDADTDADWDDLTDFDASTLPLVVTGGELATQQSCFTFEGEDWVDSDSGAFASDGDYSGSEAALLSGSNTFIEWEFTNDYTIPEGDFEVDARMDGSTSGEPAFSVFVDGTLLVSVPDDALAGLDWDNLTGDDLGSTEWSGGDIAPGTHTVRYEYDSGTGSLEIDVIAPYDDRYNYTFDNTNGGSGGYLDGPELYPDQIVQSFATASTRRDVTEARFSSTWNDVTNNQYVELANDGSTFTRFNNSDSGTATFASPERNVDTNVSLSRYGSRTSATPQTGFNGQAIDVWELFVDIDAVLTDDIGTTVARGIVPPNTITGNTVREGGLKSGSVLLTRHELAKFEVLADQRLASAESTTFSGDSS